jgi:hypothetical protein
MGDLLSRALEETALFSRTKETSQDISVGVQAKQNFETFPVAL